MKKIIQTLNEFLVALFERHQFVRRSTFYAAWALVAGAHVAVYAVIYMERIVDGVVATIFGTTCALVGTMTKFYIDMRVHDGKEPIE